jgi:hypothetical protein
MVYVDDMELPYGRMIMCHMGSPDLEELHKMAQAIGIARKWFQNDKGHPHYDVCKSMKKKAIELGAVEVSGKELIRLCYPNLEKELFKNK